MEQLEAQIAPAEVALARLSSPPNCITLYLVTTSPLISITPTIPRLYAWVITPRDTDIWCRPVFICDLSGKTREQKRETQKQPHS